MCRKARWIATHFLLRWFNQQRATFKLHERGRRALGPSHRLSLQFLFDTNGRHLRLFQVRAGRDRRTIVDTWIECVAAHHCLHVTFSECHKKTTFFEQPKRSVVNFKKYCGQSRGWFVSSNLNSQDHNIAFLMVNDSH